MGLGGAGATATLFSIDATSPDCWQSCLSALNIEQQVSLGVGGQGLKL